MAKKKKEKVDEKTTNEPKGDITKVQEKMKQPVTDLSKETITKVDLSKPPKPEENEQDPRVSFQFGGTPNTSRAGTTHPVVYGEIFTGSTVISMNVTTDQVSA